MAANLDILITATDKASGTLRSIDKSAGGLGKTLGGVLKAGAFAGVAAVGALGVGLASSVKAAMESQEAVSQLNAVLKSTGGVAGVTSEAAQDLANSLQKVTPFSDEATLAGESMLLTFTNIGKDIFPQATEAMLDMSQALGQDVQSSAIQLGKALNDPIRGVTALRRVGVQLTEQQEEQIKTMVEAGDVAGAQAVILQELQKEFGGSARAAGETFGGQMAILKNRLSEVQEKIGMAVIPILIKLGTLFVDHIVPAVERFGEKVGPIINQVKETFESFLALVTGSRTIFEDDFQHLSFISGDMASKMVAAFETIKQAIVIMKAVVDSLLPTISEKFGQMGEQIKTSLEAISSLIKFYVAVYKGDWGSAWDHMRAYVSSLWELYKQIITQQLQAIYYIFQQYLNLMAQIWGHIWNQIKTVTSTALSQIVNLLTGYYGAIYNAAYRIGSAIWQAIFSNVTQAVNDVARWIGSIPGKLLGIAGQVFSAGLSLGKELVSGIASGVASLADMDIVPGPINLSLKSLKFWQHGGIVTRPTLGVAGEAGPEAIIPLNKAGGLGMTVNFYGNVYGMADFEDKVNQIIRDKARYRGYRGISFGS